MNFAAEGLHGVHVLTATKAQKLPSDARLRSVAEELAQRALFITQSQRNRMGLQDA